MFKGFPWSRRINKSIGCVLDQQDLNPVHSYYYNKPIINKLGTGILNGQELFVSGFYFRYHENDTCISNHLKEGILFEKFILSFIQQYIDPVKNILDIGANIGIHSVVYANYVSTGKVYAFEPQPVVFNLLKQNLEINNCKNVIPFNYGASNKNDVFFMNAHYDSKDNQGAFRICENNNIDGIYINCKILDELNLENIGFVKMDVEGHEFEALQGLLNTLKKCKPRILIEIHESSPTKEQVFLLLQGLGYIKYIRLTHCDYLFI